MKTIKNIASSVKYKLLNKTRATNKPFQELFEYYAMERLLFRLSKSKYKTKLELNPVCFQKNL